jgi:hypothetical protein
VTGQVNRDRTARPWRPLDEEVRTSWASELAYLMLQSCQPLCKGEVATAV